MLAAMGAPPPDQAPAGTGEPEAKRVVTCWTKSGSQNVAG